MVEPAAELGGALREGGILGGEVDEGPCGGDVSGGGAAAQLR
jgi:hypothetical protein